jgi:hypothetical protein
LTTADHDRFRPASPEEVFLVDILVSSDWLLRRVRKVEAQLWQYATEDANRYSDLETKWALGKIFGRNNNDLTRLQRRIDSATRAYHRALDRLDRLRSSPISQPQGPRPKLASFRQNRKRWTQEARPARILRLSPYGKPPPQLARRSPEPGIEPLRTNSSREGPRWTQSDEPADRLEKVDWSFVRERTSAPANSQPLNPFVS